jgi:hypothetical protein
MAIVTESTSPDPLVIDLSPGDHVCGFYLGSEARDRLLLGVLRGGLVAGEKCVCIIDKDDHAGILDMLDGDDQVDGHASSEKVEMLTPWETYLHSPDFSSEDMLAFWSSTVTRALGGGQFTAARTTGDTTAVLRELEGRMDAFIGYESELNRFVQEHPVAVLCLYNLELVGGGILVDLMKTHPKLILGGMVLENPHSLSPDEFLASRS